MDIVASILMKVGATKALNELYTLIKKSFKKRDKIIVYNIDDTSQALEDHLNFVKNWADEISFKNIVEAKETLKVFIHLEFYLFRRDANIEGLQAHYKIKLIDLLKKDRKNIIILGQPGMGKTTSMKYICQSILYNESFFPNEYHYPIIIRLRELNNNPLVTEGVDLVLLYQLLRILNIKLTIRERKTSEEEFHYRQYLEGIRFKVGEIIVKLLDTLNCLLILDGFDEILSLKMKGIVAREIEYFALRCNHTRIILTSRTGEFPYHFQNTSTYEIAPLSNAQIYEFASKWLNDKDKGEDLFSKIKKSPFYDTTTRPLIIGYLCNIYERYNQIPEKPKTVYKLVIELLIKDWDAQRNIKRLSKYSKFEVDRKYDFMSCLAYTLTVNYNAITFSRKKLIDVYHIIYKNYNLPINEAKQVVNEIESHNGLIIQIGHNQFEFAHKSIQEFLTADYLTRLPKIPSQNGLINRMPHEFALCVAISSNPSLYFSTLVFELLSEDPINMEFVGAFFKRLIIEKPDFIKSDLLGFGYLYIFFKYFEKKQMLQRDIDIFCELGYDWAIIDSLQSILKKYYEPLKSIKLSEHSFRNFRLVRRIEHEIINKRLPENVFLPEKLYSHIYSLNNS